MWVRLLLVVISLLKSVVEIVTEWWFTTEIKAQLERVRDKWKKK